MFGRLAWAAAQGCKQLVQSTGTCSASASASCSMAARHATHHSAAGQSCTSSSRLNAWHQLSPSQPGSGWRVFTTGPGGAMPRNILENAAELQMQKLKSKAKDVGQEHTMGARVRGIAWDSLWLGVTGFTLFSGYYSFMYRDVSELDAALRDARESLAAKPADPSAGPGPGGPAAVARKGPPIEPAMVPPATMAWCAVMERYLRIRKYIEKSLKDYRDPTYDKLLPDMAPELRGRIKTLVLDLDDTLVHKEWTRQTGWKIYKRPGVQDFLLEMGGYYEVVVFTDTPATYAEPIISKLDPHRVVLYRLYRPETQYHNGKHVRDLSKLNRDLSQVLMISSNPDAWEFQPENTIKLRPWQKDTGDTTLLDLIPMLQLIATKGVKDVRDVVRSYDGEEDIPRAFKTRMAQIAGQQKQPKQRGLLSSLGK